MEHLNHRQFNFRPLSIHWDRHHYYSEEELRQMWKKKYAEVMSSLNTTKE